MQAFQFKMGGQLLTIGIPTVRECDGIFSPVNGYEQIKGAESYLTRNIEGVSVRDKLSATDILSLVVRLGAWLAQIKETSAYKAPPVQSTAQIVNPYNCTTTHIKAVAEYARMSFQEVWELPITDFWKLFRDAIIWNYSRTAEGIDQLEHAKAISATEPDRDKLGSSPAIVRRRKNGK